MSAERTTSKNAPSAAPAEPAPAAAKAKALPAPAVKPAVQKAVAVTRETASPRTLVAAAPESKKNGSGKRQRLSKAFSRPLEKKLKPAKPVRDRFTLPEAEYAALASLKKRLADQGVKVKKSDIVRAGLALVSVLDDAQLQALMAKVPPLD